MDPGKLKSLLLKFLKDILTLVVLGNLLSLFIIPQGGWSFQVVLSNCLFSVGIGYPAMTGMKYIGIGLERRLPWLKYPVKRLIYQVLFLTLFSALVIFVGFSVWLRMIGELSWRDILGTVTPALKVVYTFLFLSLLTGNAVLFFKNWKKATIRQEELKRVHLALQYQTLRDQIKPHFLFNSLSSLVNLINSDTDKATEFVHKLSDVYRYVIDLKDAELVPLAQELKFLEDYVYLQQIRFGDKLSVQIDPDIARDRLVIPLSMQMLVENAIKHNEITEAHPLEIRISWEAEEKLAVGNSLRKIEKPGDSTGTGLENLRKRIAFFSDEELELSVSEDTFRVNMPTFSQENAR